jgi:hypothetical protein
VLNRFSSFLDRPTIHNIVSQPNRIDFHRIMREGKIFLANLEKGGLQDAAYALGSFILSRLQLAALARRPGERKLFPILVDEFYNFAGTGMDTESIETFLSEVRSHRVPLVVATQYVGRLNRDVVTALFANVGTMAALYLGQIDAQPLARELGEFTVEDLLNLEVGEAVVRMGSAQDAFNVKVPLALEQESQREEIIALSRERYCKPRRDVEKLLAGDPERLTPEPQSSASGLTPDEAHFEVKNIIQAIEAGYEEVLCLFRKRREPRRSNPLSLSFSPQTHWNESRWPRSVGSRTTCEMYEGRTEINCEHPELY